MKISLDRPKEDLGGAISAPTAGEAPARIGLSGARRGVVVEGVKGGPSPAWLQKRIESMGLHPINKVVDVTNHVLFSTSHPIHAFDLDKITGARVILRRAKKGERLLCLDGTDPSPAPAMAVIT